jgi:hypothetical protein
MAAISVGGSAPGRRPTGEIAPPKNLLSSAWPAGFRAFAITVRPPPTTAPSTTATFSSSPRFGTSVARYVMRALSLNAVSTADPMKSGASDRLLSTGAIHHPCSPP